MQVHVKKKAIVVGSGLSGITSALILAKHGYEVTLVEHARKLCITLRGFFRKKIYFDTGLHFVGEVSEHGLLNAYLRYLDIDVKPSLVFDKDNFETIRFADDSSFSMPIGYDEMVERLVSTFPSEEAGIVDYMREMYKVFHYSSFHSLEGDFRDNGDDNPLWQVPLKSFIEARIQDKRLRKILSISSLLYGVSPEDVTFLNHARVVGTYFDSAGTFEQGGYSLVKACEQRMKQEGIDIRYGCSVNKIICSDSGILKGVTLESGEQLNGDVVIYTGHPTSLATMLPDNTLRKVARERIESLQDTISAHVLYMTASVCPPAVDKKNVIVCLDDEPFERTFDKYRRPAQGPFYIMPGPSVWNHSGEGKADIVALAPCYDTEYKQFFNSIRGARSQSYIDFKKQRLAEFSEALFRSCPDLSSLDVVDGATPLTLRDYLDTPHGGLYGAARSISQHSPLPRTKIPNLFLAGQAIAAPGVLGAIISGFLACGYVVGHERLLREVRVCR